MPDLYLHDNIFGSLSEHELKIFLNECDTKELQYIRIDDISWQLLPPLLDATILVKPLSLNPVLASFVQNLKTRLYRQGANVILDRTSGVRTDLSEVLDVQIFVDLGEYVPLSERYDLNLYYSLRAMEKSMALIGGMVKEVDKAPQNLTYHIASYWKHLTCLKHYKILHSQIPSILIEFSNPEIIGASLNDLVQNMLDSMICLYGSRGTQSELVSLNECWETATKPLSSGSPKMAEDKPLDPAEQKSDKGKSFVKQNTKPPLKSALGRRVAKKQQCGKATILSPPSDGPVNYFIRPSASATQPRSDQSYLNNYNLTAPSKMRSTFRKHIPSPQEQQLDIPQNKVEKAESNNKTFLQGLKLLEKIIDNK